MANDVRILTFVTNFDGAGPGHSAVAVGSMCYTFEDVGGGWFSGNSGWKTVDCAAYMKSNEHRPILVQTLNGQVVPTYVIEYVKKSKDRDDDYIGSGVCSTQVSKAVNYALPESVVFNPRGIDTPFGVFYCARRLGLVTKEEYFWPGRANMPVLRWAGIVNKLKSDYPDVLPKMDVSR